MAGTFTKIDYRLRPAKHAERLMLVDLFRSLRFAPIQSYQYVGLGSVAFVDFRLFHRQLGISAMISIEATGVDRPDIQERFRRNAPFRCIDIRFGKSSNILPGIDFNRPSIVWLDYDDALDRYMAADLATVARTLAVGSFVGFTFECGFPIEPEKREERLRRLRDWFPDLVRPNTRASDLDGGGFSEIGRRAVGNALKRALADADADQPADLRREARQVCNFRYRDGTQMATIGWVVVAPNVAPALDASSLDLLSFYRFGAAPFKIRYPLITPHEIGVLERFLPSATDPAVTWVPERERGSYVSSYRYLPQFGNVEP